MPKHTSLSCQQLELNNAAIHAAAKSQVEAKRAKKKAVKIKKETIDDDGE
jgi:hypothetical protein